MIQGFLLYRIFYGDVLVYVGRTKQPLQNRIRGHLFSKPMHRAIDIEQVTRIEYAAFPTEADMNLYEIYYILKYHPPLNVDDKARDSLTVTLPEAEWQRFETPLWEKWRRELTEKQTWVARMQKRYSAIPEEMRILRSRRRCGELTEDKFYDLKEALDREYRELQAALNKHG